MRALVVDCRDGSEIACKIASYPSGSAGILLDPAEPQLARQYPGDYLSVLATGVRRALAEAAAHRGFQPGRVIGIGLTATGSSPLPVDRRNGALAMEAAWCQHPAAQCWLWKDHTSWREAAEITALARRRRPQYLARCGGTYSSEWFWAKILHCLRTAPEVFVAAHSWVELGDWIGSILSGVEDPALIHRGECLAGLKALCSTEWGGLPDEKFLSALDPRLAGLRSRLYERVHDAGQSVGRLCTAWADALGLPPGLPVANAGLDCHAGAIGCGVKAGTMVKVIGTSGCDCMVLPRGRKAGKLTGICGVSPGAILPGHEGIEAGQSAVGDIFRWWTDQIGGGIRTQGQLTREATRLVPGQSGLLALDWHNGNRSILTDPRLTGVLIGCTLTTSPAEVYRALIEATAFGARVILDNLVHQGVPIRRIVCTGGIAEKNPLLMQIYADVLGRPMQLAASRQACALGAAIAATVAAGFHAGFFQAQRCMVRRPQRSFRPCPRHRQVYGQVFRRYRALHDLFGERVGKRGCAAVMKDMLAIRTTALPRELRNRVA